MGEREWLIEEREAEAIHVISDSYAAIDAEEIEILHDEPIVEN